jgi:putative DNA primase/helicase
MSLRGKRFITGSEFPQGVRINEAVLKRMTGQDTQAVRDLHSGKDQFAVLGLIVLRYNERPKVDASDDATWNRIIEVPFERQFTDKQQDVHLKRKLLAESSGIFNWLLEGCLAYQREGMNEPPEVQRQSESYRQEMDTFAQWFTDRVALDSTKHIKRKIAFEDYTGFCMSNDQSPISDRLFYDQLRAKGFKERKSDGEWRFSGFWLNSTKAAKAEALSAAKYRRKKRQGRKGK